jgi:hypothetical protein
MTIKDKVRNHVEQSISRCMLRQTSISNLKLPSPTSEGSDMNSRGDYLSSGRSSNLTQNRFSFPNFATSQNGEGVPLVVLSDVQSVNEYEDEFSWAAGPDGLHKHHGLRES